MHKMIPVKPETYDQLKEVKQEAEKEVGVKIDWNAFILGALAGAAGTAAGVAIAKAIARWLEQRKEE